MTLVDYVTDLRSRPRTSRRGTLDARGKGHPKPVIAGGIPHSRPDLELLRKFCQGKARDYAERARLDLRQQVVMIDPYRFEDDPVHSAPPHGKHSLPIERGSGEL